MLKNDKRHNISNVDIYPQKKRYASRIRIYPSKLNSKIDIPKTDWYCLTLYIDFTSLYISLTSTVPQNTFLMNRIVPHRTLMYRHTWLILYPTVHHCTRHWPALYPTVGYCTGHWQVMYPTVRHCTGHWSELNPTVRHCPINLSKKLYLKCIIFFDIYFYFTEQRNDIMYIDLTEECNRPLILFNIFYLSTSIVF